MQADFFSYVNKQSGVSKRGMIDGATCPGAKGQPSEAQLWNNVQQNFCKQIAVVLFPSKDIRVFPLSVEHFSPIRFSLDNETSHSAPDTLTRPEHSQVNILQKQLLAKQQQQLQRLLFRERLRLHCSSLKKSSSSLHQISLLADGTTRLLTYSQGATLQLRYIVLQQQQRLLRRVHGLCTTKVGLTERQHLCQILSAQLRIPVYLLKCLSSADKQLVSGILRGSETFESPENAGENLDCSQQPRRFKRGVFSIDDSFFHALEELRLVRNRALQLRLLAASSASLNFNNVALHETRSETAAGATAPSMGSKENARQETTYIEFVQRQATDVREDAYECLYIWLQQTCKSAAAAVSRWVEEPNLESLIRNAQGEEPRPQVFGSASDEEVEAALQIVALSHALAAAALSHVCDSTESLPSWMQKVRYFVVVNDRQARGVPHTNSDSSVLRNIESSAYQKLPLLLRAYLALRERPAYLHHCLQELVRVRQQIVVHTFASSLGNRISEQDCSAITGSTKGGSAANASWKTSEEAALEGSLFSNCHFSKVYPEENTDQSIANQQNAMQNLLESPSLRIVGESGRLAYDGNAAGKEWKSTLELLAYGQPIRYLRGVLRCITKLVARERAVTFGLLLMVPPSACTQTVHSIISNNLSGRRRIMSRSGAHVVPHVAGIDENDVAMVGNCWKVPSAQWETRDVAPALSEPHTAEKLATRTAGKRELWSATAAAAIDVAMVSTLGTQCENSRLLKPLAFTNANSDDKGNGFADVGEVARSLAAEQLLEHVLSYLIPSFEARMQQLLLTVQQQAEAEPIGGGRHMLTALLVSRLLDQYAVFLRRLVTFETSRRKDGGPCAELSNEKGLNATSADSHISEDSFYLRETVQDRCLNDIVLESKETCTESPMSKRPNLESGLTLAACCEAFATKAEQHFLLQWEQRLLSLSRLNYIEKSNSTLVHLEKKSGELAETLCTEFFAFEKSVAPSKRDLGTPHMQCALNLISHTSERRHRNDFLGITVELYHALDVLHRPSIELEEETAAAKALLVYLLVYRTQFDADFNWARWQSLGTYDSASCTSIHKPSNYQAEWVFDNCKPAIYMKHILPFFRPAVVVESRGRRSAITGLRSSECSSALDEDRSETLRAWVESTISPLVNVCRQEMCQSGNSGEAAVSLLNIYACIQIPLRRFNVCKAYYGILSEFIEKQLMVVRDVEAQSLSAQLGLQQVLDAVRSESEHQDIKTIPVSNAGNSARKQRPCDVLKMCLEKKRSFCEVTQTAPALDEYEDSMSAENCARKKENCKLLFETLFGKIYKAQPLRLPFIERLIDCHLRSKARSAVMEKMSETYAEIHRHTIHLNLAIHSPEEFILLLSG